MNNLKRVFLAGLAMLAFNMGAYAQSITFDYVGSPLVAKFPIYGDILTPVAGATHMTGSVTFSGALADSILAAPSSLGISSDITLWNPEISFSVSDGVSTLTQNTAGNYSFYMSFLNGGIDKWDIYSASRSYLDPAVEAGDIVMQLYSGSPYNGCSSGRTRLYKGSESSDDMYDLERAQAWTRSSDVSAVPVPAALPLMASALGLFGFARRRFA